MHRIAWEWPEGLARSNDKTEITGLLRAYAARGEAALRQLIDRVYPELHRIARRLMAPSSRGQTLNTTGLVHEVYLKGPYYINQESYEANKESGSYFQEAIDRAPDFALAHWGLAQYYSFLEWMGDPRDEMYSKAWAEVLRTLDLDARVNFAGDYFYIQDFGRAIEEHRSLLEAEPDIALAQILLGASLVEFGDFDEGIARLIKGMEIQGVRHR